MQERPIQPGGGLPTVGFMSITAHIVVQSAARAVVFYRDASGGHRWNVSQRLRDVPHEEVVAAAAMACASGPAL